MSDRRFVYHSTVGEISEALNVSTRRVQQLVGAGMPKSQRGRYDFVACLSWMVRHQQELIRRRESESSVKSGDAVRVARARLLSARTANAEIDLAERRGEMIPLSIFAERMGAMIMTARQQLLNLPARVSPSLEGETKASTSQPRHNPTLRSARGRWMHLIRSCEVSEVFATCRG